MAKEWYNRNNFLFAHAFLLLNRIFSYKDEGEYYMLILFSIFILIIGLIMLFSPDTWWLITESWKSNSAAEPSDFYIKLTRIGGGLFSTVGVGGIIAFFILP